jgi:hypothetical protein
VPGDDSASHNTTEVHSPLKELEMESLCRILKRISTQLFARYFTSGIDSAEPSFCGAISKTAIVIIQ